MLEKLILRRFQCHKKLEIDLGHITTLVGKSDSGKSAVLRGLRLVCRNAPAGVTNVRHGADSLRVEVRADGRDVARVRGTKRNEYLLDGQSYKALGAGTGGVPAAVQALLQTDDINFAGQHDPPFWFADTPGQVSKALNRIVNLDVIDRTLGRAATAVRQAQAVEEVTEARVKEAEEAVKKLEWVRGFDEALSAVISARDRRAEADNKVNRLETLLDRHDEAVQEQDRLYLVSEQGQSVVEAGGRVEKLSARCDRLRFLLKAHRAEVERGKTRIGDFDPVEEAKVEGDKVAEECGRLEWLMGQYDQALENLCNARTEQKEAEKKLGDRCLTCGQTWKSSGSSRPTCTSPKLHR